MLPDPFTPPIRTRISSSLSCGFRSDCRHFIGADKPSQPAIDYRDSPHRLLPSAALAFRLVTRRSGYIVGHSTRACTGEPHARHRPPNPPAPRDVRSGRSHGGGSRIGAPAFDRDERGAPDAGQGTSRQDGRIDRAGPGDRCAAPSPASPSSGLLVAQGTSRVRLALGVAPGES
jgi:hypothetical protein